MNTQLVETKGKGMKVGILVALLHFVVSIVVSFYRISLQVELARNEASTSTTIEILDGILKVLLFPTKMLIGEWLAKEEGLVFWLAIVGTSVLWGLFFGLIVELIKNSTD